MTDKVIVYNRPDGGMSILRPHLKERRTLIFPGRAPMLESEPAFLARIAAKDVPADATNIRIMSSRDVPADRTFRNAWVLDENGLQHDMGRAREIHRGRIRQARTPLLKSLDLEMSKAFNDPAKQTEVEAKRQALRDAPQHPDIETAQTPEELAKVWPLEGEAPVYKPIEPPASEPAAIPLPTRQARPGKPAGWSMAALLNQASVEPDLGQETAIAPEPVVEAPADLARWERPIEHDVQQVVAPALDDATRRVQAKAAIQRAVLGWMSTNLLPEQPHYELALQVVNNNPRSIQLMQGEADASGMAVMDLARRIIAVRHAKQRRMQTVYETQAKAVAEIDNATGEDIDAIAAAATSAINADNGD